MRRAMVWGVSILSAFLLLPAAFAAETGGADADWRAEFEVVCSQTDTSSSLGDEELALLIARCDKLAERIGAETEVVRKVFLKRLQRCRDLFVYVLDTRKAAGPQATSPPEGPPPQAPATPPPASSAP